MPGIGCRGITDLPARTGVTLRPNSATGHRHRVSMDICHAHNLTRGPSADRPFGIRVSLRAGDAFERLIGAEWEMFHWFETAKERDDAMRDMAAEHLYSRRGDQPTLRYEAVERTANA